MTIQKLIGRADLEIKGFDEASHTIKGMATTPGPDRTGDIIEPLGAKFAKEIPLFLYHDSRLQVGTVKLGPANKSGVPFEATLPNVVEAGALKTRVEEAWHMLKYGLLKTVSVGFISIGDSVERLKSGGLRWLETEILELSLVPVPMNPEAEISYIKSIDEAQPAPSGQRSPVVRLGIPPAVAGKTSPTTQGTTMTTNQEHIAALEAKRSASAARIQEIMSKSAEEGRTLDDAEAKEYDELKAEVKSVDGHLVRAKETQDLMITKATPVKPEAGTDPEVADKTRNGVVTWGKSNLAPGIRFTRFALCVANAKGNLMQAEILSRRFNDTTPEVNLAMKAAVAAGTTQDATWASPLVQLQEMASEFVEFLRPQTLLGRIPGLRRVPFNIKFTRQTAGTTGTFVGEGLPKPLGKMDFELLSLPFAKAATIIVMTEELVRFSNPSAEMLARDDLAAGIAQYLDKRFIDPTYAGVTNVSPASITHGVTPITSSGNTIALISDTVEAAVRSFITANLGLGGLVWIMSPGTALSLSFRRTTQDIFAFPGLGPNGGTFMGYPVITSNNVLSAGSPGEGQVILMDPSEILLADDGGVSIDMSTEASLQMDGAPSNPATSTVSMFQSNMIALRAERYIYWMKRRDAAVAVIQNVDW